jgi:hypothetical protein
MAIYTAMPVFSSTRTENVTHPHNIDNEVQIFKLDETSKEVRYTPNQTSNFDVFVMSNPHITEHDARVIWNYYREQFIAAKLLGEHLSSYRKTLQRFLENKPYDIEHNESENRVFGDKVTTRHVSINKYVPLARYLALQYYVDTTIAQLSENITPEQMERDAGHLLGTVPFNNYVSYFSNNVHEKLKDLSDYETRKLHIRSVYEYTHKQLRWYICKSEYGAVKLWVHTNHNAFLPMFDKIIKDGVTINVVTSKILLSADKMVPCLKIDRFFLDS